MSKDVLEKADAGPAGADGEGDECCHTEGAGEEAEEREGGICEEGFVVRDGE